jgi:hypothetical protein
VHVRVQVHVLILLWSFQKQFSVHGHYTGTTLADDLQKYEIVKIVKLQKNIENRILSAGGSVKF